MYKYTVSQKKVPTFKLSETLSNLNRLSNVLHYWKVHEICYKTHVTLPTSPYHLRDVATLPLEIKNSNFLHMWKKTQTNCIFNRL